MKQAIVFFGRTHIYTNQVDAKLNKILDQRVNQGLRQACLVNLILLAAGLALVAFPIYDFVINHEQLRILPVAVPFIDLTSTLQYYLNFFQQIVFALIGVSSTLGLETSYILIINNMWAATDVIKYHLDEISNRLHTKQPKEYQAIFRQVLIQVQDIDGYVLNMRNLGYVKYLVQPIIGTFCVSIAIFCAYQISIKVFIQ